jgi:type I restriction enzyme M protein
MSDLNRKIASVTLQLDRALALTPVSAPLLGSAGNATARELALAARFDELHQLIYMKGGVRPTNAAIEEVGKLLLLRLWLDRCLAESGTAQALRDLFASEVPSSRVVEVTKLAFSRAIRDESLQLTDPAGNSTPLWPHDEPFRLSEPTVLQAALKLVNDVLSDEVRVADPIGTAFDAFLSGRYDHSGGLGTFLTPSSIARFMADIVLELLPANTFSRVDRPLIADPFCGTGRFLVAMFDAIEDRSDDSDLEGLLHHGLVGADQSATAVAKTGLNLLLYGARRPHVYAVSDSMTDTALDALRGKLTVVLTNPPFGGGKYDDAKGISRTASTLPSIKVGSSIDPAIAGLARSLDLLAPGGVLGIVLPEGVVNGRHFADVLADPELHVVASVSLPTATFALSGTAARTCAVFIRKSPNRGSTVLARIDHVGFLKQSGKAVPDPSGSDIPAVLNRIRSALSAHQDGEALTRTADTSFVVSVPTHGLRSVDPNRLDPEAVKSRNRILASGGVELRTYLRPYPRRRLKSRASLPFVSVLHVDNYGTIDWNEACSYRPITPGQEARAGDLLVSLLNPSKLRAAVVPQDFPVVECSSEFGVFEPFEDPYAILAILYSPTVRAQLKPLGSGTSNSRRRITPEDVLSLTVPNYSAAEFRRIGNEVAEHIRQVELSLRQLNAIHTSGL